jgi:glycosyltransferase involved in cell wall biosynthesis
MVPTKGCLVSVIVPVYRGKEFIAKNLEIMKDSLEQVFDQFEIIVVVDGNKDKSYEEAKKVKGVRVFGYAKNMGKGFAMKYGFSHCVGDFITFLDSDMDLHPSLLKNFLPYLATADIVIGSKRHPFSIVNYPWIRKSFSKVFQLYSKMVLGVSLSDTQSGMKLMKREVLDVLMPLVTVKKYAFDLELMFLAQKHNFRTVEAPIYLNYNFTGSGINTNSIKGMFLDVLGIRYRYSFLRYYQQKYQECFGV